MATLLSLTFFSDPAQLKLVRSQVRRVLGELRCAEKFTDDFVIAVNEACMNVMQHAYLGDRSGRIDLVLDGDDREIVVRLIDYAPPVDLSRIRPRDVADVRPGGLGTHFIREVMDDCIYGHLEGRQGNTLQMSKRLEPLAT
jgi:sigma-B regulation protein RsbU (phosphoserine phosphatase)